MNKDTPLFGHVADYFWRIEYQARGAPHVHMILWIKEAPVLGKDSDEDVRKFINSIITCSMPDKDASPTLHELVNKFQMHRCNKYCQKTYKHNGKFYRKCRFGIPRPVREETELNDAIECMAAGYNKKARKRLYHLKRKESEQKINDYNAALLIANQANVDIQFIGHMGSRLPYYITDYITKHERVEQDDMWKDIFSSAKSLGTNAMSFLLKSVKSRQVGSNEAADRLLGHKLYSKSKQIRFADLQPADKVKRVLKRAADIKEILDNDPSSTDIFMQHWVQDVYPDRPDSMESVSLFAMLSWYEKQKNETTTKLKTSGLFLRRRKDKPYIVTHQLINPNTSDETKETYFYYLLKLFKPWRKESDLSVPGQSYSEHFREISNQYPEMITYHNKHVRFEEEAEELNKAIKDKAKQVTEVTEPTDEDDCQNALQGCVVDQVQTAMDEVVQAHMVTVQRCNSAQTETDTAYNSLNKDQKRIVDKVVSAVCEQDTPIHLIVSGQGGTGKSRVIDILNQMVSSKFSPQTVPVTVSAPTGLAAFNISGTTIHRTLCLPIEHGKPPNYSRLNQENLAVIRKTLHGLKLLIIDEVSMVSSLTLLYIHLRLTEIMANEQLFGGISVVLFADLLQLPPVKGNQPFLPVTFLEAKQRLGAIASIDLWKNFQYEELTINMRQNNDKQYGELLQRVRVGQLNDDDEQLLRQRLIQSDGRATVQETE